MVWLAILSYFSILVFIILNFRRGYRIAKAPVHLRWELYPVPHEKGKSKYGGSHVEEYEWWNKPQHKSLFNEVKTMASEIILLKAVFENNKSLWLGSFPFHFGLYLYIVDTVLLILDGLILNSSVAIINQIILVIAWAACILGIVGSLVLLFKRMFNSKYSIYSNPSHYFNIIVIGAFFVTGMLWINAGQSPLEESSDFLRNLYSYGAIQNIHTIGIIHISLALFLVLYIPFTHMTHFFTKYFTYHHVRWDDAPNTPGSKMEQKIAKYLNYPVSWAAPHIGSDGTKTWIAIATSDLQQEVKK